MENNKRTIIPTSCDVIKTGKATKEGKSWTWTLYRVEAVVLPSQKSQTFSSFDDFSGRLNQEVEVEVEVKTNVKDGKTYTNYNVRLPKRNMWYELDKLTIRVEALEAKSATGGLTKNPTTSANEPSLGDESVSALPEDAFDEPLPF